MRACRDYSTGSFLKNCADIMALNSLVLFFPGSTSAEPIPFQGLDNFSVIIFPQNVMV